MCGLMSLVLYSLKRNYPSSIKGLGEWSAGLLAGLIGTALGTASTQLPAFISIFVARVMLAAALYLIYVGTQRFFGVTPKLRNWLLLIAAMMLAQLWFTVVEPSFRIRLGLSNVLAGLLFAAHAHLVFKQGIHTFARALTLSVLVLMALIQVMRLATPFIWPLGQNIFDTSTVHLVFVGSFVFCILLFSISTVLMASERLHAELEHLVSHDALTNAATRRHIQEACEKELERCRRHGRSMALMIMDLDNFKQVNDTYGHQAGDQVLVDFVAKASALLRRPDQLGRYGGEEFMVMLPDTSLEEAVVVAERIRETCALPAPGPSCTVSIGVTTYKNEFDTVDTLLTRADAALYRAKGNGRNRTETA
jgi:diguanylate cyclase (GGDEF)-like protein